MSLRRLLLLPVALGCLALAADASESRVVFEEGKHYVKLPFPIETRDAAKIEVVEMFSYACIHCYNLEPLVNAWHEVQPDDVDFHRVHLVSRRLQPYAQAYYTADALGILPQVHIPMFEAIHKYGVNMSRPEHIRRLFVREGGVDEADFTRMFDSFGIRGRLAQAEGLARMYRIMATPTLVVNGRYVVEAGSAGSPQAMFVIVNELVDRERSTRLDADGDS